MDCLGGIRLLHPVEVSYPEYLGLREQLIVERCPKEYFFSRIPDGNSRVIRILDDIRELMKGLACVPPLF